MKWSAPARALVIVDSALPLHVFIRREILPVMEFWGFPCEIFDLADPPATTDAAAIGVVVLLHEGVPPARLERAKPVVDAAVAAGAGIVNFDPTLEVAADANGLRIAARRVTARPIDGLRVAVADHFIAAMQLSYREFRFLRPVAAIAGDNDAGGFRSVPLRATDGMPILECSETGPQIANWRISLWLWSREFFGFTRGLDAFFWRTLLWAAKKPFAIAAFPPLGRIRIDDCRGFVRTPEDAGFLDVLEEFDEIVNLGICTETMTDAGWAHLAAKARAGRLEVAPHVMRPEEGIFSVDGAPRDNDDIAHDLRALFARHDCPMSPSISDHSHEMSARGLAIARQLGLRYRMNVMRVGEPWRTPHKHWPAAPFGCMHFALDRFADDPEIFIAINHTYSFSDSFLTIAPGQVIVPHVGGYTDDRWDFLNGHIRGFETAEKDIDRARQRLQRHAELCLTSLFFAGSISHTHFCRFLAQEEWRHILHGYRDYADRFGYRPLGYDGIAAYAAWRAGLPQARIGTTPGLWAMTATGAARQPTLSWGTA